MKEIRSRFQGGLTEVKEFKTAMTSLEVAEITGKEHKNILADIRDESEKLEEVSQLIFQPSIYEVRGKEYPMYNLTKDGVHQLGARYDAKIRFSIIQRMNQLESKPVSQLDLIIQSAEALKLVTDRIENLEDKFDSVVTLPSGKQRKLQKAIACRVYERINVLCEKKPILTVNSKESRAKLFSAIHRELKNKFGVSSYKDIKVAEYETALHWIQNWIENSDIREEI